MRHRVSALLMTTRRSSQEEVRLLKQKKVIDHSRIQSCTGDDTLKLWDIRSFKRPVNIVTGLDNMFAGTDCVFSPDEQTIMTGVSVKKGEVMR